MHSIILFIVIPPPDEKISNVDRDTDVVFDKAVIGHILGIGGDFEAAFEWVVKTSWEEILTNVGFDISHNSVFDQFQEKVSNDNLMLYLDIRGDC